MNIFLSISLSICFGYSKRLSHRDCFLEYPQHMFRLRIKKSNLELPFLIWATSRENPTLLHANNIGTDKPAHLQSDQRHCYLLVGKYFI